MEEYKSQHKNLENLDLVNYFYAVIMLLGNKSHSTGKLSMWVATMKDLQCPCQATYSAIHSCFEPLVPQVLPIRCLVSSTCEHGPCYSGEMVSAPSMPCLTDVDRACGLGYLQTELVFCKSNKLRFRIYVSFNTVFKQKNFHMNPDSAYSSQIVGSKCSEDTC